LGVDINILETSVSYSIDPLVTMHMCFYYIKYVGSCHHCMAYPWVADGGDSLQMWRVAMNILN